MSTTKSISATKAETRLKFCEMVMSDEFLDEMQKLRSEVQQRRLMRETFLNLHKGHISDDLCRMIQKAGLQKVIIGSETKYGFKNYDINFDEWLARPTRFVNIVLNRRVE